MYVCQLTFECEQDLEISAAQQAISLLLDQYRYNGQIIGREFPVILTNDRFEVLFVCPEQESLSVQFNNDAVEQAFQQVLNVGLTMPQFEVKGLESQSDFVDLCDKPKGLILYSTFVQSCSPVRCSEHFAPVPLYKLPEQVRKPLIKWQESHAACDQLQMNSLAELESSAVKQMSDFDSCLMTDAKNIALQIQQLTDIPVYIYLYRVGGESFEQEQQRTCPSCGSDWQLQQPLFNLFDFKCDRCQLLSNISWNWQ